MMVVHVAACMNNNHKTQAPCQCPWHPMPGMAGSGPGPLQGIYFILHVLVQPGVINPV
jgi:hypothetical protein